MFFKNELLLITLFPLQIVWWQNMKVNYLLTKIIVAI